jgi:hypothetical protein
MLDRRAIALLAVMGMAAAGARAHDETKYPDWKGEWSRGAGPAQWDPSKRGGLPQQPPLTAQYQAIVIGKESYFLSADGHLMPTRKEQPAPDLRYFNQSRN